MKLVDFIRQEYSEFTFTDNFLYKVSQTPSLYVSTPDGSDVPTDREEFLNYELLPNTKVVLYQNVKTFEKQSNSTKQIELDDLRKNSKKIKGLGKSGLESMEEILGDTFTLEELSDNISKISNIGKKTLENIIEFVGE
jgi:hypothetical protein